MTIRVYKFAAQVLYTPPLNLTKSVSDTLAVSDEATRTVNTIIDKAETDDLALVDVASNDFNNKSVSQVLNLEQFYVELLIPSGISFVDDPLGLAQEAKLQGYEAVTDELGLDSIVLGVSPRDVPASQGLNLQSYATGFLGIRASYEIAHPLDLSGVALKAINASVAQSLNLVQDGFRSYPVVQILGVIHRGIMGKGAYATSTLGLTQAADVDLTLNQALADTNIVSHSVAYFYESRCGRSTRNNFHGLGGTAPEAARLEYSNQFLIQSRIDPSSIVQLRNPESDDKRRYAFQRVKRSLYDGTLDLYSTPDWVTEQTQLYTIVATKRATLDTLWTFLLANLGLEVQIKDWFGITWNSIVTNPGEIYTEDGEGVWTLDFEVVGVPFDGEPVYQVITLAETLSRAGSTWTRQYVDAIGLVSQPNLTFIKSATDPLDLVSDATRVVV